jgi:hypothetical protein
MSGVFSSFKKSLRFPGKSINIRPGIISTPPGTMGISHKTKPKRTKSIPARLRAITQEALIIAVSSP